MTTKTRAQMAEAFTTLAIDDDATYLCVITEGESAALACQDRMSGIRVRNLIQAQTRLADSIEQGPTGRITVRLGGRGTARNRVCVYTKIVTEDRDFIMVGQCQGSGYTLWDIAPAPVDLTRRQMVVEELDDEAADADGSTEIVTGATAREAVNSFLMDQRQQSGLHDYDLTADSQTDRIAEVDAVRAHATPAQGAVNVFATVTPGPASFAITGAHAYDSGVTGRIKSGIEKAGLPFPTGQVSARIDDHRGASETLDLAITCAVLGAAGQIDRYALDRIACLGGVCDGLLTPVYNLPAVVTSAHKSGYRTVLVPATQVIAARHLGLDIEVIGAHHLTQAVDVINQLVDES
ncbi:hypothetical protein ABZ682_22985 [Streptomyces griseoviridis]|uniref:hypothetical protein n=1 Tax=Streptomyces griseoviridis TaxID=45398 RepID=UPI0033EA49BA